MSDRVDIRVSPDTKAAFQEYKRDGETWDGVVMRAADALDEQERKGGQAGIPVCSSCSSLATAWTLIDGAVHCEDCADVEFPGDG